MKLCIFLIKRLNNSKFNKEKEHTIYDGLGLAIGVGVIVKVGVGVGVTVDEPLKTILGLWLLVSVTVKLLVVSWMVKVSVPAFCEVTVKVATPFWA